MDPTESRPSSTGGDAPAKALLHLNNRWTAAQVIIAATAAIVVTAVFANHRSMLDLVTSFLGCIGVLIVSSWILAAVPYVIVRITRPQTPKVTFLVMSAVICAFCSSLLIAASVSVTLRGKRPGLSTPGSSPGSP